MRELPPLSQAVRRARQQHGWSQAELADRLAIPQSQVNDWELGLGLAPNPTQQLALVVLLPDFSRILAEEMATPGQQEHGLAALAAERRAQGCPPTQIAAELVVVGGITRLRACRLTVGLTSSDLVEWLRYLGEESVSVSLLWQLETGDRHPTTSQIRQFCRIYQTSPDQLGYNVQLADRQPETPQAPSAGAAGSMVQGPEGHRSTAEIGAVIAAARARAGLSQAKLAEALDVQQSSVSQWERGTTIPTLANVRQMIAVLGPWPLVTLLLPPAQADTTALAGVTDHPTQQPDRQESARLMDQRLPDWKTGERDGGPARRVTRGRRAERLASRRPRGRRPSKEELARQIEQGLSDREIGDLKGVADRTVKDWRHDYRLLRPGTERPSKEALAGLIQQGLSDREIGERYGVGDWTVVGWRHKYKLVRSPPLEPPSKEELAQLIQQGLSDQKIGEHYGKSSTWVARLRGSYDLSQPPRVTVDPAQVLELLGQGQSIDEIAERLGCSSLTVRRRLHDATHHQRPAPGPRNL